MNGKIYVFGGVDQGMLPFSRVQEYDPDADPFAVSSQGKMETTWGAVKRNK